jgi:cytochrome c oxidase assembly protein subunit 11
MSTHDGTRTAANRRLGLKLAAVALGMFGFGFALVPLYDLFCEITGLNGKTRQVDAQSVANAPVDTGRTVMVEFMGHAASDLPWEFRPLVGRLEVHPGETVEVKYYARNTAARTVTGQAVPSVTPGRSAAYFKKIECFCFTQQELAPGEAREMPVWFVVDADLPRDVHTITLSYAFFNTGGSSARNDGGEPPAQGADALRKAAHMPARGG